MMAYWLMKSEPGCVVVGPAGQGRRQGHRMDRRAQPHRQANLKKMKKGDRGFFYHSGEGKEIVGIVEIVREPIRPDRREAASRSAST